MRIVANSPNLASIVDEHGMPETRRHKPDLDIHTDFSWSAIRFQIVKLQLIVFTSTPHECLPTQLNGQADALSATGGFDGFLLGSVVIVALADESFGDLLRVIHVFAHSYCAGVAQAELAFEAFTP